MRYSKEIVNQIKIIDEVLSSSKEEKNFKEFIKILFTSFIRIKKYGKYYIKITFFNQKRECIKTIRYTEINSFSLNFKATLKEYPPLYLSW